MYSKFAVFIFLSVMIFSLGGFMPYSRDSAIAAPKLKPPTDDGLIWTYHCTSGELTAYSPAGVKEKSLKLKDGRQFRGFTPDGKKIVFVGVSGKLVGPEVVAGTNIHLRDINEETEGHDTGIAYSLGDQFVWSHDGKRVIRERRELVVANGVPGVLPAFDHRVIDLKTKKEEPLRGIDRKQQVMAWSRNDEKLLLSHYSKTIQIGNLTLFPSNLQVYDFKTATSTDVGESEHVQNPVISRNGRMVFGVGYKIDGAKSRSLGMVSVELDGGKTTEVFRHENQSPSSCAWSLDDKRVAYLWYDTTTKERAYLVICDPEGRNARSLAIPFPKKDANEIMILGWFPR
jgi:Tol biopolymer transport system component